MDQSGVHDNFPLVTVAAYVASPRKWQDELVKRCLLVIADADFPGIVIGIHMDEFRKTLDDRDDLKRLVGTP